MKLRAAILLTFQLRRLRRRRYAAVVPDPSEDDEMARLSRFRVGIQATRAKVISFGKPPEQCKYTDPEALFAALEAEDTLLLRASWLKAQHNNASFRLPRRGDELPPEATISADDLREIHYCNRKLHEFTGQRIVALPFVALSHVWHTAEHADPDGVTARLLAEAFSNRWHQFARRGVTDLGVFIDVCSVATDHRRPPVASLSSGSGGHGCREHGLWFAHAGTTVWMASQGVDARGKSYCTLASCCAERALAHLLKMPSHSRACDWPQLVDLGKSCSEIDHQSILVRPAPLSPLAFAPGHLRPGLNVGAHDDARGGLEDFVAPMFERTMVELLGTVTELDFGGLRWGDEQAAQLATVLPLCVGLRVLRLDHNHISDAGVKAIAPALAGLTNLRQLQLQGNARVSKAGMAALARVGGEKKRENRWSQAGNAALTFAAFAKQPLPGRS